MIVWAILSACFGAFGGEYVAGFLQKNWIGHDSWLGSTAETILVLVGSTLSIYVYFGRLT